MKENSNFFERLMVFSDSQGFKNINEFAEFLGYSSAEKLYRLKRSPSAKPSFDIIHDISNKFEILDLRWLITGNTYNSPDSPPESRQMNEPTDTYASSKAGNIAMVPIEARTDYIRNNGNPDYISKLTISQIAKLKNGVFRAFEVEGNSMAPTLTHGDTVFAEWVEKFENVSNDHVYVIVTKTYGIIIKRIFNKIEQSGILVARSDNSTKQDYPNINIPTTDILELWHAKMYLSSDFGTQHSIWNRINELEESIRSLKGHKEF
ncbi:S24 family peptidase [Marivirga sp. S37H4]|uniref:S24 family peptidase n=1 Tax=Marivirga aurantiaca TaxID=2802615 RepID=A0A934WV61_9BACT|nr:S24 family peptidase [Marivirga aurantiaca]MBK6263521.1 S24 family peptidase [Marivirga aurantiaca]